MYLFWVKDYKLALENWQKNSVTRKYLCNTFLMWVKVTKGQERAREKKGVDKKQNKNLCKCLIYVSPSPPASLRENYFFLCVNS